MLAMAGQTGTMPRALGVHSVSSRTWILSGLVVGLVLSGCGVVHVGQHAAEHTPSTAPVVKSSTQPCAVQTTSLLTQAQMPPELTPQGPPVSLKGPRSLLDDATDGSVGSAFETFLSAASAPPAGQAGIERAQILQVAEGIVDYGTVATAERWMSGQGASNRPNDLPMYANGVERVPELIALGDATFIYQIDQGAPYKPAPYDGPYVGRVYTALQVRDGDLIYAVSVNSVRDTGMPSLAISVVQTLIAKERAVCG